MKNKLLILCLSCFLTQGAQAQGYDAQIIQDQLKYCEKMNDLQCYEGMLKKYNNNVIKYYYAYSLISYKKYKEAKTVLREILSTEKTNKELIKASEDALIVISKKNLQLQEANDLDAGDYYDDLERTIKWYAPYNIKVFIASDTGKEHLIKQAFQIWDDALRSVVSFSYVDDEQKADIVCDFVYGLDDNAVGKMYPEKVYNIGSKTYFKKVKLLISLKSSTGAQFPDKDLLSSALHEIGHSIGIMGHSKNVSDVMYYSTESIRHGAISRRDINTIKKIYRN